MTGTAQNRFGSLKEAKMFTTKVTCARVPNKKSKRVERSKGVVGIQQLNQFIIYAGDFILGMTTIRLAKDTLVASSCTLAPKDTQTNEECVGDAFYGYGNNGMRKRR